MQRRYALFSALLVALATAACETPKSDTGQDPATQSNAALINWTDGLPAYAISCDLPGGCQTRALAICKYGPYSVLKSENMPSAGNRREPLGPPSTVIRCG